MRGPPEVGAGAAGVELQVGGLMDAGVGVIDPGGTVTPGGGHFIGDPGHGLGVCVGGAEVVSGREFGIAGKELFGEADVAVKGFDDVLPGTDGKRAANAYRLAGDETADQVGNEGIGRPVAAADDVAGARGGEGDLVLSEAGDGEVGLAEGCGDNLGAGLGAGVGVVAAQGIGLAVGPDPLAVFVALVGGDADDGADGRGAADGIEHAGSADDVGLVSADGVGV